MKGQSHGQKLVFEKEADEAPDVETGDVVVVLQMAPHPLYRREGDNLFIKKQITLVEALTGFQFHVDCLDGRRRLLVRGEPGGIIKPGDHRAIRDEGMPMHKNSFVKGQLFIEFDVAFPAAGSLSSKAQAELKKILPAPPPEILSESKSSTSSSSSSSSSSSKPPSSSGEEGGPTAVDEEEDGESAPGGLRGERIVEEVALHAVNIEAERRSQQQQARSGGGGRGEAYAQDEDDEDERRGGGGGGQPGCQTQ